MKPIVYLSGPITGLSFAATITWRKHAIAVLGPHIECLDPLRGMHDTFQNSRAIPGLFDPSETINDRVILRRDHFDTLRSTVVLCNVTGAKERSLGTTMEIAWAFDHHIPIVAVMERTGNVHDSPMFREALTYRFTDLDRALCEVQHLLLT